ncbi:MAG TPA: extracellular solute-binding protein, partial [Chloroflexota bacterium]|nr:extracellular solute-binding protein [Chloroflexota bacterium]
MTIDDQSLPNTTHATEPASTTARQTRRYVVSGVAALPVVVLAACGQTAAPQATGTEKGGAQSNPAGQTPAGAKLNTAASLFFMNSMGGPYAGVMEEWATTFQEKTGVKVETSPGTQDFANKLDSSFAAGTPPDIFIYHQERIPIVAGVERKMLLRLDDYVKRDRYDLNDFRKDSIDLYRWKGGLYALPRDYGLQLVWYNVDHFQRAGVKPPPANWQDTSWTFNTLLEAARKLTVRSGSNVSQWGLRVNRAWRPWASWVYSNGGAVVKKNGDG